MLDDEVLTMENEDPRKYRNETALVEAIRRQAEEDFPGAWVLKTHGDPYQESGLPDMLIAWGGRMAGLEVKHPKKGESEEHARYRTNMAQRKHIVRLRENSITADTVLSVAESRRVLHLALHGQRDDGLPLYDPARALELFEEKF